MGGEQTGTLCASELGPEWIDAGTLIRTRSCSPGPIGISTTVFVDAKSDEGAQQRKRDNQAMFAYDIDVVAESAFGKTKEGAEIVKMLRKLNRQFNIEYGNTIEGSRGDWDGSTIRVSDEYAGKMFPTVLELVHEASHALWRKKHPRKNGVTESKADTVSEELHAQENQLLMYKNLKQSKGYEDAIMEMRLKNQANGTLRQKIESSFE